MVVKFSCFITFNIWVRLSMKWISYFIAISIYHLCCNTQKKKTFSRFAWAQYGFKSKVADRKWEQKFESPLFWESTLSINFNSYFLTEDNLTVCDMLNILFEFWSLSKYICTLACKTWQYKFTQFAAPFEPRGPCHVNIRLFQYICDLLCGQERQFGKKDIATRWF